MILRVPEVIPQYIAENMIHTIFVWNIDHAHDKGKFDENYLY
jgi:hypothetical protein